MKLLTKSIEKKLRNNAAKSQAAINKDGNAPDFKPVLKVFNPSGAQTWLFTELHADNMLFGLCDLGLGEVELGYVSLDVLMKLRGRFGLAMERDRWFSADKTLSQYLAESKTHSRIIA